MKTNQILPRKMGDFNVYQRTSDSMFNATALVEQWNKVNNTKLIADFIRLDSTKVFVEVVKNRENHNMGNPILSKKGKNGGTWMHPLVFIDFAMWLNPDFKYDVLKFVYDELIKNRHDAGDNYRLLAESISKIVTKPFLPIAIQNIAKAINYVVFNKHESGIRNTQASEESLKQLSNLELKLSELINDGFIKDYDQTMSFLRRQWNNNHQPKLLKQSA